MDGDLDPPSNLHPLSDFNPPSKFEPSLPPLPPPPSFMCPIGHEVMLDLVSCADGHSYEQSHIERWFKHNIMSPLTGAILPNKIVISNHALCNLIQERPALCEVVEVDENTPPPGGSNSSNAQPKRKSTRGRSSGKKKRAAEIGKKKRTAEIDYEDYDSVVSCIQDYKANIVDLETKVTQLKEQGRTMKQRHENGEFVWLSRNRKP